MTPSSLFYAGLAFISVLVLIVRWLDRRHQRKEDLAAMQRHLMQVCRPLEEQDIIPKTRAAGAGR